MPPALKRLYVDIKLQRAGELEVVGWCAGGLLGGQNWIGLTRERRAGQVEPEVLQDEGMEECWSSRIRQNKAEQIMS